jgi:hypothetical protein
MGGLPRVAIGLALAALAVLGVGLALVLGGGDDDPATEAAAPTVAPAPGAGEPASTSATSPSARGDVTVAVLNGTTTPGLARRVADDVKGGGYKLGTVANATEQNRSATTIQYVDGARDDARTVASLIGIGGDAISQLDQSTLLVAGEAARVVVTVGADQNQAQQE